MKNNWWKLSVLTVLISFCFIFPGMSRAFDPYIEHSIPRYNHGWGGGCTWYNGYIYEVTSRTTYAIIKDPVTGEQVGTVSFDYSPTVGLSDIAYDAKRNTFWVKGHGTYYYQFPVTGGAPVSQIYPPGGSGAGVFWGPDDPDSIWVTNSNTGTIYKVSALDGTIEDSIFVDKTMTGIAKVDDTFWCAIGQESGHYGVIIEVNMSGQEINSFRLPVVGYMHDVGGCTLDDDGYLWVEGGKETAIYQINIGYDPTPDFIETDIIDSGDYNGDGMSDIAIFRETTGLWAVRGITRFYFGKEEDIPVSGDYNNDGMSDAGIFRGSTGLWAIRNITRGYYGSAGDIPVPGDYNGDGVCDRGIFRSSNGLWAVKDLTRAYWGVQSDLPVPGYYSHSRQKSMGIYRPSSGLWAIKGITRTYFGGQQNDVPLPSVAGGIGSWEPAIFRPSSSLWAVKSGFRAYFGIESDKPAPGDYDGYGGNEPTIFREVSGLWAARGVTRCYYGQPGDTPVSGRACNPSSAQESFSFSTP